MEQGSKGGKEGRDGIHKVVVVVVVIWNQITGQKAQDREIY